MVLGSPHTSVIKQSSPGDVIWSCHLGPGQGPEVSCGAQWSGVAPQLACRLAMAVHVTSLELLSGVTDFTNHGGLLNSKHSPVSDGSSGKYDIEAQVRF